VTLYECIAYNVVLFPVAEISLRIVKFVGHD